VFRARSVGKFKVILDSTSTFSFESKLGTFTAGQKVQLLNYVYKKQQGSIKFSDIKGLEYHVNVDYAVLEELMRGIDFHHHYQDTIEWFSITALANDGKRIPLYLSGQYQPREFMFGWYIDLQAEFLTRLGLITDVEAQSLNALDLIQSHLGDPKLL
jgi:hypothetical protein